MNERHVLTEDSFAELVIWQVPATVKGSTHSFKYRLAFVVRGECVVRYDNEIGKGDHRHAGGKERAYTFTSPEKLLADFWQDVDNWRK